MPEVYQQLHQTFMLVHSINPRVSFDIFINKVDEDVFPNDDGKLDFQNSVSNDVYREFEEVSGIKSTNLVQGISYHLTSIYDYSVHEVFSKVVQKLFPEQPSVEVLLNQLGLACDFEKVYLFDMQTHLYFGTDENFVDQVVYELCIDCLDLMVDTSLIYGGNREGPSQNALISVGRWCGCVLY